MIPELEAKQEEEDECGRGREWRKGDRREGGSGGVERGWWEGETERGAEIL